MVPHPPVSAAPTQTVLLGLGGFVLGSTAVVSTSPSPVIGLAILLLFTGGPMWWAEWRRLPAPPALPIEDGRLELLRARILGLALIALLWAAVLGFFSHTSPGNLRGVWDLVFSFWPVAIPALAVYLGRAPCPYPGSLEALGRGVRQRRFRTFPLGILRDHLVKAFFLPLMLTFVLGWVGQLDRELDMGSSMSWFLVPLSLLYLLDTVFGAIGYLSTSYRLQSHIRSSNPSWWGWIAALICYPPFVNWLAFIGLMKYGDGYEWHHWLGSSGLLAYCWGGTILALTAVYTWATVAFGIRFSNLTCRGVITSGPYRYLKHPAYWSKNLSWWLVSIPFISFEGTKIAILHCMILGFVNCIYWLRAKTEEKHMMSDPDYVAYASWVDRHGLWARIRRFARLSTGEIPARPLGSLAFALPAMGVVAASVLAFIYLDAEVSMTAAMDRFRSQWHLSAGIAMVAQAGKVPSVVVSGVSAEGNHAFSAQTVMPLASLTKPITAMAVRKLAGSNAFRLDDPLVSLLPELANEAVDERFGSITLRHLLQHTAGFDRSLSNDPIFTTSGELAGCPVAMDAVLKRRLDHAPGQTIQYANVGYCFLGRVIERVTGVPYEKIVGRIVTDGPRNAPKAFDDQTLVLESVPKIEIFPEYVAYDWNKLEAAGGLFSDGAGFLDLIEREKHFEEIIAQPPGASNRDYYYGLGWRVWKAKAGESIRLTHYGSLPGVFTFALVRPGRCSVVAFFRGRPVEDEPAANELAELLDCRA